MKPRAISGEAVREIFLDGMSPTSFWRLRRDDETFPKNMSFSDKLVFSLQKVEDWFSTKDGRQSDLPDPECTTTELYKRPSISIQKNSDIIQPIGPPPPWGRHFPERPQRHKRTQKASGEKKIRCAFDGANI